MMIYRHYKGCAYKFVALARDQANVDVVLYEDYCEPESRFVGNAVDFLGVVETELGEHERRFKPVTEADLP